jgi:hypothetical protein
MPCTPYPRFYGIRFAILSIGYIEKPEINRRSLRRRELYHSLFALAVVDIRERDQDVRSGRCASLRYPFKPPTLGWGPD